MIDAPINPMSQLYTLVPRAQGSFAGLDCLSRYAFGLIFDRYQLSTRPKTMESWHDDHGYYCVYDRAELARDMGVTLPTVRRCIKALEDAHVLTMRRAGTGAAWRYYVSISVEIELGKLDLE